MKISATNRLGTGLDIPRDSLVFNDSGSTFRLLNARPSGPNRGVGEAIVNNPNIDSPIIVTMTLRFDRPLREFESVAQLDRSTVTIEELSGRALSGGQMFRFDDIEFAVAVGNLENARFRLQPLMNGDDQITGNNFDDIILANAGNDRINGNGGDDRLSGMAGSDVVQGGLGDDQINGGAGFDTAVFAGRLQDFSFARTAGGLIVTDESAANGDEGTDTVLQVESLQFQGRTVSVSDVRGERQDGGGAADSLTGTVGPDVIIGRGGNDKLDGGGSRDTLIGGDGVDVLRGRGGSDRLFGGNDNDVLIGDGGIDVMRGNDGNDKLFGGADGDALLGQDGADVLRGDAGDDKMYGGDGNDVLIGHAGNDKLLGDAGDDRLIGGDGVNVLRGRSGVDKMFGGEDRDVMIGDDGVDILRGQGGDDRLFGGDDNDSLLGKDGDDRLRGNNDNDRLWGQDGDDRLQGDAGADKLFGGDGNDIIDGGAGNDRLVGNAGADVFVLNAGSGNDVISDFTAGEDRIDASAHGFADFAAIQAAIEDVNGSAVVTLTGGASVTLIGVLEADLRDVDFGFNLPISSSNSVSSSGFVITALDTGSLDLVAIQGGGDLLDPVG